MGFGNVGVGSDVVWIWVFDDGYVGGFEVEGCLLCWVGVDIVVVVYGFVMELVGFG